MVLALPSERAANKSSDFWQPWPLQKSGRTAPASLPPGAYRSWENLEVMGVRSLRTGNLLCPLSVAIDSPQLPCLSPWVTDPGICSAPQV